MGCIYSIKLQLIFEFTKLQKILLNKKEQIKPLKNNILSSRNAL